MSSENIGQTNDPELVLVSIKQEHIDDIIDGLNPEIEPNDEKLDEIMVHKRKIHNSNENFDDVNPRILYDCQICQKTFSLLSRLKSHTRAVHEKIKDNDCEFCDKSFK